MNVEKKEAESEKVECVEGTRAACKSVSPGSGGQFSTSPGVPVLNGHRMKSAP